MSNALYLFIAESPSVMSIEPNIIFHICLILFFMQQFKFFSFPSLKWILEMASYIVFLAFIFYHYDSPLCHLTPPQTYLSSLINFYFAQPRLV